MRPGRLRLVFPPWTRTTRVGATLLVLGCAPRDRLTFPTSGPPGSGPETIIDRPAVDTTVTAGPGFTVTGYTRDADGLDTTYFETQGGISSFPPFIGGGDSIRFGLPLTTLGQSGQVISVRVFATDLTGVRGDTAIRHVTVQ